MPWERMLVLTFALGGVWLYDGMTLRRKMSKRDKYVYGAIMVLSLYMGIDYAVNADWPDLFDIVGLLKPASNAIDKMLRG